MKVSAVVRDFHGRACSSSPLLLGQTGLSRPLPITFFNAVAVSPLVQVVMYFTEHKKFASPYDVSYCNHDFLYDLEL